MSVNKPDYTSPIVCLGLVSNLFSQTHLTPPLLQHIWVYGIRVFQTVSKVEKKRPKSLNKHVAVCFGIEPKEEKHVGFLLFVLPWFSLFVKSYNMMPFVPSFMDIPSKDVVQHAMDGKASTSAERFWTQLCKAIRRESISPKHGATIRETLGINRHILR